MPKTRRMLTNDPAGFAHAQGIILRWLRNAPGCMLSETKATRLIQQEFGDTKAEIQRILRSPDILRDNALLMREVSRNGTVSFQMVRPEFRSVRTATDFIGRLRVTRGYSEDATSNWRRLSMQLSDCALIQFARRLAARLEGERNFLIGIDEQDFDPKIYVLKNNSCCILALTKRVDEHTRRETCSLGMGEPLSGHVIDPSKPPTDTDFEYALALIGTKSWRIS